MTLLALPHFCHLDTLTLLTLDDNRFKRCFLGIGSCLETAIQVGTGFSSVDGTHMHHIHYRTGVAHILTTYDGNNKCIILAMALCETESGGTWDYFGTQGQIFGLGRYLSLPGSVVMHDRMKGIERFMEYFPEAQSVECFLHIINNIYRNAGGKKGIAVQLLWQLRKAETFKLWFEYFKKIGKRSFTAADYINNSIDEDRNWRWKLLENGVRTYSRSTSQLSEGSDLMQFLPFGSLCKL